DILSLVVALGAVPGVIGFFHLLNSHILSKGVYFVLDKAQRILTLPRVGRSLQQLSIVGFVEVHAWHTTKDTWGSESSWLAELSVLIREENGQISRFSVLINEASQPVSRIGNMLSDFFRVPRLVLRKRLLGTHQCIIEPKS